MAVMTTVEVISHGMALLPNQRQIQGKDVEEIQKLSQR